MFTFFLMPQGTMDGLGREVKGYIGIISNALSRWGEQIRVCRYLNPGYPKAQELVLVWNYLGVKWFLASLITPHLFSGCRIHGCIWGTLGKAWNFPLLTSHSPHQILAVVMSTPHLHRWISQLWPEPSRNFSFQFFPGLKWVFQPNTKTFNRVKIKKLCH